MLSSIILEYLIILNVVLAMSEGLLILASTMSVISS
jgi:hypothetical protein